MITKVSDLVAALQKVNGDLPIRTYSWVDRRPDSLDDTDMSGYEPTEIVSVSEKKVGKELMVFINIKDWMI
jgi:hypothetical protein